MEFALAYFYGDKTNILSSQILMELLQSKFFFDLLELMLVGQMYLVIFLQRLVKIGPIVVLRNYFRILPKTDIKLCI